MRSYNRKCLIATKEKKTLLLRAFFNLQLVCILDNESLLIYLNYDVL